jgi:hypothetical protein
MRRASFIVVFPNAIAEWPESSKNRYEADVYPCRAAFSARQLAAFSGKLQIKEKPVDKEGFQPDAVRYDALLFGRDV